MTTFFSTSQKIICLMSHFPCILPLRLVRVIRHESTERLNFSNTCVAFPPTAPRALLNRQTGLAIVWSSLIWELAWCLLDDVVNADPNADQKCWPRMLTLKEMPQVKFFQYTRMFSVSRRSPRATNYRSLVFLRSDFLVLACPPHTHTHTLKQKWYKKIKWHLIVSTQSQK